MSRPSHPTHQTILAVRGLRKSFGARAVHRGIHFDLHAGELLGLFGGSGSGKSVILRSIIGLEKPDEGAILFEGLDLVRLSERRLAPIRKRIAYVFQNGALFDSMTVEENLAYPLKAHTRFSPERIREEVDRTLENLDLKGTNHLLPAELSGGMQKRVGLARATMLDPDIILFDEPTAGLDPAGTRRLLALILRLKARGITGIFVTHDIPSALAISDRIAILHEGCIIAIDTVENIRHSENPLVRIFLEGSDQVPHPRRNP